MQTTRPLTAQSMPYQEPTTCIVIDSDSDGDFVDRGPNDRASGTATADPAKPTAAMKRAAAVAAEPLLGEKFESRSAAVLAVQAHSTAHGKQCQVDRASSGGKNVVLRCSTVLDNKGRVKPAAADAVAAPTPRARWSES